MVPNTVKDDIRNNSSFNTFSNTMSLKRAINDYYYLNLIKNIKINPDESALKLFGYDTFSLEAVLYKLSDLKNEFAKVYSHNAFELGLQNYLKQKILININKKLCAAQYDLYSYANQYLRKNIGRSDDDIINGPDNNLDVKNNAARFSFSFVSPSTLKSLDTILETLKQTNKLNARSVQNLAGMVVSDYQMHTPLECLTLVNVNKFTELCCVVSNLTSVDVNNDHTLLHTAMLSIMTVLRLGLMGQYISDLEMKTMNYIPSCKYRVTDPVLAAMSLVNYSTLTHCASESNSLVSGRAAAYIVTMPESCDV